jgi:hypothetical protein
LSLSQAKVPEIGDGLCFCQGSKVQGKCRYGRQIDLAEVPLPGWTEAGIRKKLINFIGILFLFMVMIYPRLRRVHCQNTGELTRAKSGEKKYPARKSRKREGSASLAKEITPRRTPKRLSRKRTSRPTLDLTRLSGEKTS